MVKTEGEFKNIPEIIWQTAQKLEKAGFEAYLIGGCVRDIIIDRKPNDWDFTTNATPEEIIALFEKTFYENTYGTVGVVNEDISLIAGADGQVDETLKVIEITPYRLEAEYSDNRRPDSVSFSKNLEDDLKRRDFTINAIGLHLHSFDKETGNYKGHLVDLYKGQGDLAKKIIRTVGLPEERFAEDGLRILRAVRIATDIGFKIEDKTKEAIAKFAPLLEKIAKERIREEFTKIIMSDNPERGLNACYKLGILKYIIPELEKTISIEQGGAHIYDVWEHSLKSLQCAADKKYSLEVRLAALLHDIGKPKSRRAGTNKEWSFYGHEVVGARLTEKILNDLRYPKKVIEKTVKLVRWHMFFSDTELISLSAVRRIIAQVGKDSIWDLMNVRICDRVGMGKEKEDPYRLRKYHAMIDEATRDPITVGMLKLDGRQLMEILGEKPGPKIGFILHAMLEDVLDDPKLNTEEYLTKRARELVQMTEKELKKIGEEGKKKKEEENQVEIKEIRKKHSVK